MESVNAERRRLLQAVSVLVGGGAALAFTPPVRAWDVAPLDPKSPAGLAYAGRCGGDQEHAVLTQKLRMALANDPAVASLSAACPICGCPIIVSR